MTEETILLITVVALINVLSFTIGAKIGQKVVKGEKIELPKVNPIEAYRELQEKKEVAKEKDKIETIMRNIEKYDGTAKGQEDVPM